MDFVEAFLEGTPSFLYKIRPPDPQGVIGGGIEIISNKLDHFRISVFFWNPNADE